MLVLKACSLSGCGRLLHNVSHQLLSLQVITFLQNKHMLIYNPSRCQGLKKYPIFGTILTYYSKYFSNGNDGTGTLYIKTDTDCQNWESDRISTNKQSVSSSAFICKLSLSNLFNRFTSSHTEINNGTMSSVEAMAQLESNAQTADSLIQEIYSKLAALQNCNPELGAEAQKLIKENEALKLEVHKWKQMLLLQQIRNGGNPVVRDAKLLERSATVASTCHVKREVQPNPGATRSPQVDAVPPQQSGKKGKGGEGNPVAAEIKGGGAQKGGKQKAGGDQTPTETEEVDVGRLDLRVGLIKECTKHPDADSLYVEKIDVGEPNVRTVISGLVKHVPIDAMQNRMVVVLCNLKPSKMRGIMSEAMVMCASSPEKVEILAPPSGSLPGDVIEVKGYTRRPEAVMNPKKKIFETVAPDLKTNDNKQATYKGEPWTVPGKGFVVAESLMNVNVK